MVLSVPSLHRLYGISGQILSHSLAHMSRSGFNGGRISRRTLWPHLPFWHGLGFLVWPEVCFLQIHTEFKNIKFLNLKMASLKRSLSWMGQCRMMSIQCISSPHYKKSGHQKAQKQDSVKTKWDRACGCPVQGKTPLKGQQSQHLDVGFWFPNPFRKT